jgi:ABC-type taurine transport system substrate-binding protein
MENNKVMKTLKCDLCDHEQQGATFEEWMDALKPHYAEAHPEVMSDPSKTMDDMQQWMAENKARFDAA